MRRKKKKLSKNKKKFFIIVGCYLLTFILTAVLTSSTLAWYNGSTWQSEILYMGGPVYIHFEDNENNITSGANQLVTETPDNWPKLYPGMAINFQAKAVVEGKKFEQVKPNGEQVIYFTTGAVLRARIDLDITDPYKATRPPEKQDLEERLYGWIWSQLFEKAHSDLNDDGIWLVDELDAEVPENNYFYYVRKGQNYATTGEYFLTEVGGTENNAYVSFLNNCTIVMPPIDLTNDYADCIIKFTVIFEGLQAFFPYEREEVGTQVRQGDGTFKTVTQHDVGLEKPLLVEHSRKMFEEARWDRVFPPSN